MNDRFDELAKGRPAWMELRFLGREHSGGYVGRAGLVCESPARFPSTQINNLKILGVIGRRKTPWTGDTGQISHK